MKLRRPARRTAHRPAGVLPSASASIHRHLCRSPVGMKGRYDIDVLAGGGRPRVNAIPEVSAEPGLVVEDATTGFCGAVVDVGQDLVLLEDRFGKRRAFPLEPAAFRYEGKLCTLTKPVRRAANTLTRTASGSVAVAGAPARVARRQPAVTWRACTTPPSSSASGETTCASRASWSSCCTAVDVLPERHRRIQARPAGRGSASWLTTWFAAARKTASPRASPRPMCWSPATRTLTSGRPSSPSR